MFGANKRLRELGKDTTDYTNYNTAAAKTKRYRELYYDKNSRLSSNKSNGSGVIIVVFFVICFLSAVIPFIDIASDIISDFEETFEIEEQEVIVDDQNKYDAWVEDYYSVLESVDDVYDNYYLSFADINFDGIPEMFYKSEIRAGDFSYVSIYMYYYYNGVVTYSYISNNFDLSMYYSKKSNDFIWATVYEEGNGNIVLYKYDRFDQNVGYYIDYDYVTSDAFYEDYQFVVDGSSESVIYNLEEDFYDIVDSYYDEINELENKLSNYKS